MTRLVTYSVDIVLNKKWDNYSNKNARVSQILVIHSKIKYDNVYNKI